MACFRFSVVKPKQMALARMIPEVGLWFDSLCTLGREGRNGYSRHGSYLRQTKMPTHKSMDEETNERMGALFPSSSTGRTGRT